MMYGIFGTAKDVSVGPTAVCATLVAEYAMIPESWPTPAIAEYESGDHTSLPELAIILSLFTGLILLVLGLLQLGIVVSFVSHSVIVGFVSSAAITIPLGQVKKLFGFKTEAEHFIGKIVEIFEKLIENTETNWYDFGVGASSIVLLVGIKYLKDFVAKKEV